MKYLVLLIAAFLLWPVTTLQAQERLQVKASCTYDGELPDEELWSFASDDQAQQAVSTIMQYTGLPQNFDIMAANVPNAAAVIRGSRRLILYSQGFMLRVASSTGTDWAATSIMAHEIGHHLSGHTLEAGGSRPKIELEADRFSGYVLQRMGATLDEAQIAMRTLASDTGGETHPAKSARLAAIENGWIAARDQGGAIVRNETTMPAPDVSQTPASSDECPAARVGNIPLAETYNGSLAAGDRTLDDSNGEYIDVCGVDVRAGERLVVNLYSDAFDTHLIVQSPSGELTQNDDYNNSTSRSRIEVDATESGTWYVGVTSYAAGETGPYRVVLAAAGEGGAPTPDAPQTVSGTLATGDDTLNDGEYYDVYAFEAQAGQRIEVEMTSTEFDTYIVVISPSGERTGNDDYEGSADRSLVALTAGESGTWRVVATSYAKGETGRYTLRTVPALSSGGGQTSSASPSRTGTLDASDPTLTQGEHYDVYYLRVEAGQRVTADLTSSSFDTYLMALSSSGGKHENDDYNGSKDRSVLDFTASEAGQWRIFATSYGGGETGRYNLEVTPSLGNQRPSAQTFTGTLGGSDRTLEDGEYFDTFFFHAEAGQALVADLTSSDFDTYVMFTSPGGEKTANDDYQNAKDHSRVELTASESGQWRVTVTSYKGGETGRYRLNIEAR